MANIEPMRDLLDPLREARGDAWTTGFHDEICGLPQDSKLFEDPDYQAGRREAKRRSSKDPWK